MAARTSLTVEMKARLFDLIGDVIEAVREGNRDPMSVAAVLQEIKNHADFAGNLGLTSLVTERVANDLEALTQWQLLYREVFDIELDVSLIAMPKACCPGFGRLIVVAEGMTPNRIFEAMGKLFPSWRYTDDLDASLDPERAKRKASRAYAIRCRGRIEADEELKNRSADDLDRDGVNTMTLEERLLYEIIYFRETGRHLDQECITICSGSRFRYGRVPRVSWYPRAGEAYVRWCNPGDRGDAIRARAVVS